MRFHELLNESVSTLIAWGETLGIDAEVFEYPDAISLSEIERTKTAQKGSGATFIRRLCAYADGVKKPLYATVTGSNEALERYYNQFGFTTDEDQRDDETGDVVMCRQFTESRKVTEARVAVWSGATITVLHNPSRPAFERFAQRHEVMRGCLSYDGNNLWLWDALAAVHPNIMQELGLEHVDCIMFVRGRWKGDVYDQGSELYKPAIQRITPRVIKYRPEEDDELLRQILGDDLV